MQTEEGDGLVRLEPQEQPGRRRVFYGWWLVGLIGLVMVASTVPVFPSMTVWALALERHFGWTRVQLSWALTLIRGVGLLLGPVVGYLGDRVISIRRMVVAGLVFLAGAFFFFSQTQNLWMFYAAFALMAAGATISGWILLMTTLSRWFVRRRATAVGLAQMVGALGALFLVPLMAFSVDPGSAWVGWRLTAILTGGLILVVAAVTFARLRNRPEDMGLFPDGSPEAAGQTSFSAFQALRTRAFWLIALGDGLAAMQVLNSTDIALTSVLFGFTSLVFTLVGGLVGDRYSKSASLACFTALQMLAWGALTFGSSLAAFYLSAVVMGIAQGGRTPIRVAILADYFGTNSLAIILGLFGLFAVLTALIGGPLAGLLYDTQGDVTGFLILALLTLLGAFCFLKARPPQATDTVAPQAAPDQESVG